MQQQEPSSANGSPQEILTAPETGYVVGADIGGTSLRLALAIHAGESKTQAGASNVGAYDIACLWRR